MNNIDLLRKRDESIIKYGKEPDYLYHFIMFQLFGVRK